MLRFETKTKKNPCFLLNKKRNGKNSNIRRVVVYPGYSLRVCLYTFVCHQLSDSAGTHARKFPKSIQTYREFTCDETARVVTTSPAPSFLFCLVDCVSNIRARFHEKCVAIFFFSSLAYKYISTHHSAHIPSAHMIQLREYGNICSCCSPHFSSKTAEE